MDEAVPAVPAPVVPGLTGLSVLARGGYATVYRAVQESVGRDVAVKIENRSLDSEHDRRRFMREARAAGRMSSHPHVVDLFDAGHTGDGHPYLIMELCDGSYADRLRAAPLHPFEVRDVGVKIADALADAHRLGVLHRDVKPANLLVSGFGEPALADFGLAVLTEARDLSITMDVLTPAYAPREMFRPRCEPSPAADVYALAATLYALLRGKPPRWFDHRDPSLLELLELFDEPIPDLPGVPVELLDLLRAGMVNDAEARPTAEQLRDELTALSIQPQPVPAEDAVRVPPKPVSRPDAWSMPTQPRPPGQHRGPGHTRTGPAQSVAVPRGGRDAAGARPADGHHVVRAAPRRYRPVEPAGDGATRYDGGAERAGRAADRHRRVHDRRGRGELPEFRAVLRRADRIRRGGPGPEPAVYRAAHLGGLRDRAAAARRDRGQVPGGQGERGPGLQPGDVDARRHGRAELAGRRPATQPGGVRQRRPELPVPGRHRPQPADHRILRAVAAS
ncbi:MAG: serine/threonine protein kinase [Actinobacteria bacterium]|nr:MAG: serine/threonine protein kinase [Actinomycetota bacterium]